MTDREIIEDFKDLVEESRQEDIYEYYYKLLNVLNLIQKQDTEINSLKETIQKQEKSREHLKKQLKGEIAVKDTEINKLNNVIDKMAEKINQAYFDKENMYKWFEEEILPKGEFGLCEYKDLGTRKKLIKEYFMKEE